jgi:hypothetical protein
MNITTEQHEVIRSRNRLVGAVKTVVKENPSYTPLLYAIEQRLDLFAGTSLERERKIAYASSPDHRFSIRRRQRTTLARFIGRQLGRAADGIDVPEFCLAVWSALALRGDQTAFSVHSGDDLSDKYAELNSRAGSCMTGDENRVNTAMLTSNPNTVSLVVYDDGTTVARALLWQTDDHGTVLDRVYPSDGGEHVAIMEHWARSHNFGVRNSRGLTSGSTFDCSRARRTFGTLGRDLSEVYPTATINWDDERNWPYLDSFCFAREEGGSSFTMLSDSGEQYDFSCQSTDGGHSERSGQRCYACNCTIDTDHSEYELYDDEYWCSDCFSDTYATCELCEEHVLHDDMEQYQHVHSDGRTHTEHACCNCISDVSFESDHDGRLYNIDSREETVDGHEYAQHQHDAYYVCGICDEVCDADPERGPRKYCEDCETTTPVTSL